MQLKRNITIALPFPHVNVDHLELFLLGNIRRRWFYRRCTEAPIWAWAAILKSLYLKIELSLFILQQKYVQEAIIILTLAPNRKSEDSQMLSALMQWVFYTPTLQPIRIDSAKGFKEHVIDTMCISWALQTTLCSQSSEGKSEREA